MICKKCGAALPKGVKFCPNCAAPAERQSGGLAADMIKWGAFGIVLWLIQSVWAFSYIPYIVNAYGAFASIGFSYARRVILTLTVLNVPVGVLITIPIDRRIQNGQLPKAVSLLRKSFLVIALISIVEAVIVLFIATQFLASMTGVPDEILYITENFIRTSAFSIPFANLILVYGTVIYENGHPVLALIYQIVSQILCVIFACCFTFSNLGFGIDGIAISIALADFITFLLMIYYFTFGTKATVKLIYPSKK